MKHVCAGILTVALVAPAAVAAEQATPAEQYQALLKQYQLASSRGRALSDEERMQFVGQTYRLRNQLALRFVELAEQHPQDPIAVDALLQAVWQVNGTPWPVELVGHDDARPRAFALLQRDHLQSDKLGPTCLRISCGFCREYETFLRAVLESSPHRAVQGTACLALGRFLNGRLQRLELIRDEPQLAGEFAALFGAEYLAELQRQNSTVARREAGAFFERAADQYGDVPYPDGGTVGEQAAAGLFEASHLSIGREAPDIVGEDQDGRTFRLSDYRGQVVLLDFWSEA
jgi:hypothetical protein